MELYDRILGCLLGGACGDTLGAPVEFLKMKDISARYGKEGITDFDAAYGGIGSITDDTQMTLFTVEGLIRAHVRGVLRGGASAPGVVHHAYRRWWATQEFKFGDQRATEKFDGWLIADERLWARRAPGNTCLSALSEDRGFGSHARNDSKGCGTVMRDAPFGLMWFYAPETAFNEAVETAKTTHGHPSSWYSSGALAAIIAHLVQGTSLPEAIQAAIVLVARQRDAEEVFSALLAAWALHKLPDWRKRVPELGEGWVAEEALAIAVLCALAGTDACEAIVAAVNHDGDSDSTGAIAGNIVGTLYGAEALPNEWTSKVELKDVIEKLAFDLTAIKTPCDDPEEQAETMFSEYPGW